MKPFSTPVLSKRTYRELKLLKHLRHENVSNIGGKKIHIMLTNLLGNQLERHFHCAPGGYVCDVQRRLGSWLIILQLLRDRASGYRSTPPTHFEAPREAIHSVLPLPDPRAFLECYVKLGLTMCSEV